MTTCATYHCQVTKELLGDDVVYLDHDDKDKFKCGCHNLPIVEELSDFSPESQGMARILEESLSTEEMSGNYISKVEYLQEIDAKGKIGVYVETHDGGKFKVLVTEVD